jgi:LuxR family maltose regulon positive regulatory protein
MDRSNLSLSPRERGIVLLMSQGLTNKQIARKLSIAPETVKTHAKRIFVKLTVCRRAQAVYRAVTLGLIALQ